jgi:4-hydroxy-tetrahydrodipicolinate reductase
MQTRIIVNGAAGRMGVLACKKIAEQPDMLLVAGLGRGDDIRQAIADTQANVVVDLTRADSVYENTLAIIEAGACPVIGTTGLSASEIEHLIRVSSSRQRGGVIAPNFSISAVFMMQFSALASRLLPDVEIVEAHHEHKVDAPSGTALKTADMIAQARSKQPQQTHTISGLPNARGAFYHGIPIHAIRLPGILAQQQVIFGSTGETLTITHNSIDRSAFMPGLILACQRVTTLNTLYYGLEHLLEIKPTV